MAPPDIAADLIDGDPILEAQIFSNKRVNVCLTDSNFLLWKQQLVLTIRGLGLEGYLDGTIPTPVKMVRNRSGEQIINPAYVQHLKQDSSLASWLLSTISANILPQLVGSETTNSVWSVVTKLYSNLSTTKIMNLHCRLRSMKKGTQSMREYTTVIKELCDLLSSCGSYISEIEHVATILNGLPIHYEPSVATITAIKDSYSVENVVSILIDAESRLEDTSRFPVGINMTRFNSNNMVRDNNSEVVSQKFNFEDVKTGSEQAYIEFLDKQQILLGCFSRTHEQVDLLNGVKPDYKFFKVFGCLCFPHTRPFNKHKFDFRSSPCTFIGYSLTHHGYLCLAKGGRVFVSRNVVFDETIFPFEQVESKGTVDVSARSRVIPVLIETRAFSQRIADQQAESRMVGVASTGDVKQSTHVECPGSSATRVESQMANEEVTGGVASSTHASQLPEDSLAHGLNDEALEQVDIGQPVPVTDQAVEEGVNVMDPVQSEGSECQEGVNGHNAGIRSGNIHPMITRRKAGIFKPKLYTVQVKKVPRDVHEALDDEGWRMREKEVPNPLKFPTVGHLRSQPPFGRGLHHRCQKDGHRALSPTPATTRGTEPPFAVDDVSR
ncbi:hypothetical protein GQ457_03G028650 [Hibiscus cannabinus]